MRGGFAGLVIGLAVAGAACQPPAPEGLTLRVSGAASLTNALAAIETAYEAAVPGADLTIATGSSAELRTQIEQGAPADVFLSADTKNPDTLVEEGLALGDPVAYAGNSLALVVPAQNPARIVSPIDLADAGVQIVAAGEEVPITAYVAELLANLAALPDYPADFADRCAANVVTREDNVRAVLAKIEEYVGDAGFVYQTDALGSDTAIAIEIPAGANVHATYAGVVLSDADLPDGAQAFLAWLVGPDGQAILADFGFVAP
jgi:molybdate transport system substrate-binding protein